MGAVGMGAPTLSQIEGWDTEHLESAARSWTATAEQWEDTFTAIHQGSLHPGGTVWEGDGAEAAQERTIVDLVKVRGFADNLFAAAGVARRGADQLEYLKQMALYAIDDARAAGFDVGEDLSLSDRSLVPLGPAFAARQAQAQALATEIGVRAAALSAADHEVAAAITAATAPLSEVAFDEEPVSGTDQAPPEEKSSVQLVDYKKSPIPEPGTPDDPATDRAPNETYPGRDARGRFLPGNSGSADGAAAAEQRLEDFEKENGVKVIRQQIRVAVIDPNTGDPMADPKTGKPLYRYYDALQPTRTPGQYIGIEVKSGSAELTRTQKIFDARVTPQTPATGTLNGEPVEIIRTRLLEAPTYLPGEGLRGTVPEPVPELAKPLPEVVAPPLRGGAPLPLGVIPDDAMPHVVDLPGHLAGAPELPVLGDGIPDYDR